MSNGLISELLEIPVTTVMGIIFRYRPHGHYTNGRCTGRPRKTKMITEQVIICEVELNRFISASVLAAQLYESL